MQTHFLAPDVYWCQTADAVVFLDLKRDRYVGLGLGELPMLNAVVSGWAVTPPQNNSKQDSDSACLTATAQALLASGLLSAKSSPRMHLLPVAIDTVSAVLPKADFDHRPKLRLHHVLHFVRALTRATLSLKCQPIHRIVERVRMRKTAALAGIIATGVGNPCTGRAAAQDAALEPVRSLTVIYKLLRVFAFTAKDACLLDSLALVEFLARYRVFPDWVFGVQTGPFAAHSWVQQGRYVLNSSVECVRDYTPILTV
jgi:hypothetical protein